MQGLYYNLASHGKLSNRGLCILDMLDRNFIRLKQVKLIILSGNFFLREGQFYTVNCLKSLDLKLFFVCTSKLLKGLFWHICIQFCFVLTNI